MRISAGALTIFLALHLGDYLRGTTSFAIAIAVAVAFAVIGVALTAFIASRLKKKA